jgi:hypothetical protein
MTAVRNHVILESIHSQLHLMLKTDSKNELVEQERPLREGIELLRRRLRCEFTAKGISTKTPADSTKG